MQGQHFFLRSTCDYFRNSGNIGSRTAAMTDNILSENIVREKIEPLCTLNQSFSDKINMLEKGNSILKIYHPTQKTTVATRSSWVLYKGVETRKGAYSHSHIFTENENDAILNDVGKLFNKNIFEKYDSVSSRIETNGRAKLSINNNIFDNVETVTADFSTFEKIGFDKVRFEKYLEFVIDAMATKETVIVALNNTPDFFELSEKLIEATMEILPKAMRETFSAVSAIGLGSASEEKTFSEFRVAVLHPAFYDSFALSKIKAKIVDLTVPANVQEKYAFTDFIWKNLEGREKINDFFDYCLDICDGKISGMNAKTLDLFYNMWRFDKYGEKNQLDEIVILLSKITHFPKVQTLLEKLFDELTKTDSVASEETINAAASICMNVPKEKDLFNKAYSLIWDSFYKNGSEKMMPIIEKIYKNVPCEKNTVQISRMLDWFSANNRLPSGPKEVSFMRNLYHADIENKRDFYIVEPYFIILNEKIIKDNAQKSDREKILITFYRDIINENKISANLFKSVFNFELWILDSDDNAAKNAVFGVIDGHSGMNFSVAVSAESASLLAENIRRNHAFFEKDQLLFKKMNEWLIQLCCTKDANYYDTIELLKGLYSRYYIQNDFAKCEYMIECCANFLHNVNRNKNRYVKEKVVAFIQELFSNIYVNTVPSGIEKKVIEAVSLFGEEIKEQWLVNVISIRNGITLSPGIIKMLDDETGLRVWARSIISGNDCEKIFISQKGNSARSFIDLLFCLNNLEASADSKVIVAEYCANHLIDAVNKKPENKYKLFELLASIHTWNSFATKCPEAGTAFRRIIGKYILNYLNNQNVNNELDKMSDEVIGILYFMVSAVKNPTYSSDGLIYLTFLRYFRRGIEKRSYDDIGKAIYVIEKEAMLNRRAYEIIKETARVTDDDEMVRVLCVYLAIISSAITNNFAEVYHRNLRNYGVGEENIEMECATLYKKINVIYPEYRDYVKKNISGYARQNEERWNGFNFFRLENIMICAGIFLLFSLTSIGSILGIYTFAQKVEYISIAAMVISLVGLIIFCLFKTRKFTKKHIE